MNSLKARCALNFLLKRYLIFPSLADLCSAGNLPVSLTFALLPLLKLSPVQPPPCEIERPDNHRERNLTEKRHQTIADPHTRRIAEGEKKSNQ